MNCQQHFNYNIFYYKIDKKGIIRKLLFFHPNMVNAFRRYVSIASCRYVVRRENKTTNAVDSSPEKAPLGVPGIPGSSLEPLW